MYCEAALAEAAGWYHLAAARGHGASLVNLALLLSGGNISSYIFPPVSQEKGYGNSSSGSRKVALSSAVDFIRSACREVTDCVV